MKVELVGIRRHGETVLETSAPATAADFTSGTRLLRNTIWNFAGAAFPMVAAVFAIPFLTRGLGTEQFGILTLAWVVIGQLNLFDLGLGRALTKLVAERLGAQQEDAIPPLFWASFLLTLALGIATGIILALVAPWLVYRVLKIPVALRPETLKTFYLIAVAMPSVVNTIGLRGFLEGCHRFDILNAVRTPASLFSYLGPLLVLPFSHGLLPVMVVLVAGRWVGWLAHLWACFRVVPRLYQERSPQGAPLREMFSFGSWMTVTNVVAPLLVLLDRFLIAATLSVVAVAYYATPYEIVTRLLVIPGAIVGVLFPVFSASMVQAPERAGLLFEHSMNWIIALLFPIVLLLVGFGREGLGLWLGPTFAANSTRVLQLLSIGILFNGLAFVAFAQVQGAGRADLTAKVHLLELPVYLLSLWALLHFFGIVGAALAWVLRAGMDSFLLLLITGRVLPAYRAAVRRLSSIMLTAGFVLGFAIFLNGLWSRVAYVMTVAVTFSMLGWSRLLTSRDRSLVYGWLRV